MFVAGLEGISEIFISGVEVEDRSPQIAKEKELGGIVSDESTSTETMAAQEGLGNGAGKKNGNEPRGVVRKPLANGNKAL